MVNVSNTTKPGKKWKILTAYETTAEPRWAAGADVFTREPPFFKTVFPSTIKIHVLLRGTDINLCDGKGTFLTK